MSRNCIGGSFRVRGLADRVGYAVIARPTSGASKLKTRGRLREGRSVPQQCVKLRYTAALTLMDKKDVP